ncbi:MAG: hypothetical protein IPM32_03080 [Ignavibacteriae bacterium]|nr:hypothetical protein [Ignavibacteriota bacterium]
MNKSTTKFLFIFVLVITISIFEIIYYGYYSEQKSKLFHIKRKSVNLVQLPDLALSTEAIWIRHRSITNIFSIVPDDGNLLEYYPSSFIYNIHLPNNSELQIQQ